MILILSDISDISVRLMLQSIVGHGGSGRFGSPFTHEVTFRYMTHLEIVSEAPIDGLRYP